MGEFSITHIILLLVIVLIFFGPSKLPQLGQSMGRAIRGFKQGLNSEESKEAGTPPEQLKSSDQAQSTAHKQGEKSNSGDHS